MKMLNVTLAFLIAILLTACNYGYVDVGEHEAYGGVQDIADTNAVVYAPQDEQLDAAEEPDEPLVVLELELQIDFATDELLATFDYIYEVDYTLLRRARSGNDTIETYGGERLVIWANVPLYDFALIWVAYDSFEDGRNIICIPSEEVFGEVSELLLGQAFVVNSYYAAGFSSRPWSGVRFTDYDGEMRYFTMQRNHLYAHPNFSDCAWLLNEFENRMDELPDNWEPWWVNVDFIPRVAIDAPDEELRSKLLEESGISEYGWRVAADFLSEFDSILYGVYWAHTPHTPRDADGNIIMSFSRWYNISQQFVHTYEWPKIVFLNASQEEHGGFFDNNGDRIYEALWAYIQRFEYDWRDEPTTASYSHHYASYFSLFDFDNTGIPDIIIHFSQTFEGCYGGFYRIFRYINGEYQMIEMSTYENGEQLEWTNFGMIHQLFSDDSGRIITLFDSELGGCMRYEHLVLVDNRVEFHVIPDTGIDWDWHEWRAHHWRIWRHTPYHGHQTIDCWTFHNPTIFRTNTPITPLHPFSDLGTEMLAYLRHTR